MKHLSNYLALRPSLSMLCLLLTAGSLAGCSSSFSTANGTDGPAPLATGEGDVRGGVYGGRQPILGAHVYLYGASNAGYSVPTGSTSPTPISGISLLGNTTGGCDATKNLYADSNGNCYYLTGTYTDPDVPANTVDNPGAFNLSGLYQCNVSSTNAAPGTLPFQQVWIYSIGGDPGVAPPSTGTAPYNPAAALMAGLGTCDQTTNNFSTLPFVYMNEVSTTAFAYAIAPFAYDATHISSVSTNYTTGLANAFANAAQLYDIGGGADPGNHSGARYKTPNGRGATPYVLINSLADILAACVNSNNVSTTDPSGISTPCKDLFVNYTTGSPTASDTANAAILIAKNPGYVQLSGTKPHIFDGLTSTEPWHPAYNDASPYVSPYYGTSVTIPGYPQDLSAAILFTGTGIIQPTGLVAGPLGNVFVGMLGSHTLAQISPLGAVTSSTAGAANKPTTVTMDTYGNLWSVNAGAGDLLEINNNSGSAASGNVTGVFGCEAAGTNCPTVSGTVNTYLAANTLDNEAPGNKLLPMASDGNGNVYIGDGASTAKTQIVQENAALPLLPVTYTSATNSCVTGVSGLAVDQSNNLWVVNGSSVCNLNSVGGNNYTPMSVPGGSGIAIDGSGNAWVTIPAYKSIVEVPPNLATQTVTNGGGVGYAGLVAIDGNSNVFVLSGANTRYNVNTSGYPNLAEFPANNLIAGSSPTPSSPGTYGFQYQKFSYPSGIAIDISGNVWVSSGTTVSGDPYLNSISELIGLAAPTQAPVLNNPGSPEVKSAPESK
jgi:hypothetical protein